MANRLTRERIFEMVENGEVDFENLDRGLREDMKVLSEQENDHLQLAYIQLKAEGKTDLEMGEFIKANKINKT